MNTIAAGIILSKMVDRQSEYEGADNNKNEADSNTQVIGKMISFH